MLHLPPPPFRASDFAARIERRRRGEKGAKKRTIFNWESNCFLSLSVLLAAPLLFSFFFRLSLCVERWTVLVYVCVLSYGARTTHSPPPN